MFFQFTWSKSNATHHPTSHFFGNKSDHRFLHQRDDIFDVQLIMKEKKLATFTCLYTKKSKNKRTLLKYKYLKFNFSVAGLKLQPFFQSSKWLKNGSDFCPKRRMGSRTKLLFQFFSPWSNTAHHLMSHIFGNKSDHKFLHQKDHILVITLIVKKDIRQRINVHLENVMKTTDFEAEEICSQSEASRGQKPFFFAFFSISSSRWSHFGH